MNYILFEDSTRGNLLPLTYTRPTSDIRIGILTIREKWEKFLDAKTSNLTVDYLSSKYPLVKEKENVLINGSIVPNPELIQEIKNLKSNQTLVAEDYIIAMHINSDDIENIDIENTDTECIETNIPHIRINNLWDIFSKNGEALLADFNFITKGRKSAKISDTNRFICPENIFIEEGASVEFAILNASTGPIYIGKDAEIMEGSVIRGPFALCEHSSVKMAAKIYGPTTIGPYSKVGGEINNSVIFGYTNKAHDGFLGNSVIGEWCNLGADTNNSNLKNNYEEVKLWNYPQEKFIQTGLQFCGLIMGDHSKCGINTMFNTGTVVGVCANIFGAGFQRNFIASFSWGGPAGSISYDIDKAIETAQKVYKRRDMDFNQVEIQIFKNLYEITKLYRRKI